MHLILYLVDETARANGGAICHPCWRCRRESVLDGL